MTHTDGKINVLIADDSIVVRGLLRSILEREPDIRVVSTAMDGEVAVRDYKSMRPDVVLMDIEMPHKDGLQALSEILAFDPAARVIMCSSLTQAGAEITCRALQTGAADCLAKPTSKTIDRTAVFERELLSKVRGVGGSVSAPAFSPEPSARITDDNVDFKLRPIPAGFSPRALAIGASTGGPKALAAVLSGLDPAIKLPVFITQHIPEGFTRFLAENLQKNCPLTVVEAREGMRVQPGHVYIAPGAQHMVLQGSVFPSISLSDGPPVNFCKPSINVMLDSLIATYGDGIVTVLLTGMGADGKDACARMLAQNPRNVILLQDKNSSVVWGIPGAVAHEGLATAIMPLDKISTSVNWLVSGGGVL